MCGIAGFLTHPSVSNSDSVMQAAVVSMTARMQVLGSDGSGFWQDAGVCLGQRRLAILDWASMAHSIELRTPLVDARLLQQVTPMFKTFAKFTNKILLAEAPNKALLQCIINRPKAGFCIPIGQWLNVNNSLSDGMASKCLATIVAKQFQCQL